jgi:hypothetical protein
VPIDLIGEFRAVGYRLRRRRGWWCWYSIETGEERGGAGDLEGVLDTLAVLQGKAVWQISTPCGIPLFHSDDPDTPILN